MCTWRSIGAPIIAQVIEQHRGESEKEVRKALREAYPWGERAMWPYKVWCSEVNRQLLALRPVSEQIDGLPLFETQENREAQR